MSIYLLEAMYKVMCERTSVDSSTIDFATLCALQASGGDSTESEFVFTF